MNLHVLRVRRVLRSVVSVAVRCWLETDWRSAARDGPGHSDSLLSRSLLERRGVTIDCIEWWYAIWEGRWPEMTPGTHHPSLIWLARILRNTPLTPLTSWWESQVVLQLIFLTQPDRAVLVLTSQPPVTFLHKLSQKISDVNTMPDPWTCVTPAFILQPYRVTVKPICQAGQIWFTVTSRLSHSSLWVSALCTLNISVSRRMSLTLTKMSPFIAFQLKCSVINIFCLHIMVIHLALYYSQVKYDTLRDTRSEHYYQLSFSLPTQFSSPHLQFFLRSSSFLSHDKKRG